MRIVIVMLLMLTVSVRAMNYGQAQYVTVATNVGGLTTNLQTTLENIQANVSRIPAIETALTSAVTDAASISNWVNTALGAQDSSLAAATNYIIGYAQGTYALTSNDLYILNQNFAAISSDFVVVSNTLFAPSNGVVPLIQTNQAITVGNFGLVNSNYVTFSNSIFALASNIYHAISPGTEYSPTNVSIPYVSMNTNYVTNYPAGMSIVFPSLASAITGVAQAVVQSNLPSITQYVTTNVFIRGTNSLGSVGAWTNMAFGDGLTATPAFSTQAIYSTGIPYIADFSNVNTVVYYYDYDLGADSVGGCVNVFGRFAFSTTNSGLPALAIGFGSTNAQPYSLTHDDGCVGNFAFSCVPPSRILRVVSYMDITNATQHGARLDVLLQWSRLTFGQ